MEDKNYKVIISKKNELTNATIDRIASLFKISTEKASDMLQRDEFIIKKQTDRQTAEKLHKAITAAGANCRIEEIIAEEETELPAIEDIATPADLAPLVDPTRSDIEPLHSKPLNFSLEEKPAEKKETEATEAPQFKSIDDAHFCPECGTIRSSANATCVHCGYNPAAIQRSNTRSTLIKVALGGLVLVAGIFLALPFYQQYAKQMQIQNDLKLAFETRNKVTEFINRTHFWPNQNIDANLPKSISNQSIESIVIGNNAVMTITLNKAPLKALNLDENKRTLIFTPVTLKGRIVWNCLKGTLDENIRPEVCRKRVN